MSLTSPRFTSSDTLKSVELGQTVLQMGSTGRAVHLVQMALLDLGFAMPRSTSHANNSPDGDFGQETKSIVQTFQRTASIAAGGTTLKDDGIIGQKTMRELDRQSGGFKHRVKLHFRSIALTSVPFERSLRNAEIVYGQYAIKAEFASGESVGLSEADRQKFNQIDQECNWDLTSGEFVELQRIGSPSPDTDVRVFHVNSFADKNVLGCGGHDKVRPTCTVTANALAWDTAHEIGHVLLGSKFSPVHIEDRRNLMHPISRSLASVPILTVAQVIQMRKNKCCRAI
ncbi:MAG: peptidoglycan-binding protein [Bryobacteraceae bacterium]